LTRIDRINQRGKRISTHIHDKSDRIAADTCRKWLRTQDPTASRAVTVVRGGETRSQSVRAALAALPGDLDVIAVHDAARPLVTGSIVARCIDVALQGFGAVAGCPAVDTMKVVDGAGHVVDTPDRATLWHAQTPQTFPAGPLREAYAAAGGEDTDDAALVARHVPSLKLKMVDGGAGNLKVTRQADVSLAEAILAARSAPGS
jgi:2-C-methyl-D-erythritol 4-phosphate cytidylyltransferase